MVIKSGRAICIVTNNPLVETCMGASYDVRLFPESSYREILIRVRNLIYGGHRLYTHPLAGSVKPNETPYRSIVVSRRPGALCAEDVEMIANAVTAYDKFAPRQRPLTDALLQDLQLIDYVLLAGALDFDAAAGLSKGTS